MHIPGEGLRVGQVWKKKPDHWLKVDKDPEELSYRKDLTTSLLHSSSPGRMPTPHLPLSPGVHLCLASISSKQTIYLCVLPFVAVPSL